MPDAEPRRTTHHRHRALMLAASGLTRAAETLAGPAAANSPAFPVTPGRAGEVVERAAARRTERSATAQGEERMWWLEQCRHELDSAAAVTGLARPERRAMVDALAGLEPLLRRLPPCSRGSPSLVARAWDALSPCTIPWARAEIVDREPHRAQDRHRPQLPYPVRMAQIRNNLAHRGPPEPAPRKTTISR